MDGSNNNVAAYRYDPYGKVITATGTLANINPLRYRGYYYDTETGFYYLHSRYYDTATCRFLNADDVFDYDAGVQGFDLYVYAGNNPVNRIDVSGRDSDSIEDLDLVDDDQKLYGAGAGDGGVGPVESTGTVEKQTTSIPSFGQVIDAITSAITSKRNSKTNNAEASTNAVNTGTIGGRGQLRKNMLKHGSPPSPEYQAHHGLPWKFKPKFDNLGININDPLYGRWVKPGGNGGHQSWSGRYNNLWSVYGKLEIQ